MFNSRESEKKSFRRGVSESIAFIFLTLIILAIATPLTLIYIQRSVSSSEIGSVFLERLYERDLERVTFNVSVFSSTPSSFTMINSGSITIDIVSAWVDLGDGGLTPITLKITLRPGDTLDLGLLADNLTNTLGRVVSPTDIVALVTSRGNIIPVSQKIYE
ncbi:MAG: hypothetical protein ABWJ42_05025, partial [Sulfolobales archaeon]